jgi:hypothetical protein
MVRRLYLEKREAIGTTLSRGLVCLSTVSKRMMIVAARPRDLPGVAIVAKQRFAREQTGLWYLVRTALIDYRAFLAHGGCARS